MRALLLPPCLALLGCPADSDSKLDTGDLAAPSLEAAFALDAVGSGEDRLGAVQVEGNLVSIVLSGVPHRGVAYQHHDWQGTGYVLFDLLTVAEDGSNLAVTYLYEQDGQLPYAYTESFEHPMDWEVTTGTVSWEEAPTVVTPGIPALTGRPEPLDVGITIEGDDLWLEGESGGILLEGNTYDLLPFATVDCTDCPGGPWLELHCLMEGEVEAADSWAALSRGAGVGTDVGGPSAADSWGASSRGAGVGTDVGGPSAGEAWAALSRGAAVGSNAAGKGGGTSALACFGIVYLFPDDPDYAQLSYGICLPTLETPSGEFEVGWSGGLVTAVSSSPVGPPAGRPPRPR
jgi:hypothetical protein